MNKPLLFHCPKCGGVVELPADLVFTLPSATQLRCVGCGSTETKHLGIGGNCLRCGYLPQLRKKEGKK
jgi:hypothetical protein